MERLTKKYGDYEYGIKPLDNECKVCASCLKCEEHLNKITQKLGEYEAIGLEPGEVKDVLKSAIDKTPCNVSFDIGTDMYNIALEKSLQNVFGMTTDEVTDIIDNYKNGKFVELPCKNWLEYVFGDINTFYCIDNEDDKVIKVFVDDESRISWVDQGHEDVFINGIDEYSNCHEIYPVLIGKEYFTTYEEAKQALKEREHNN